METIKLPESDVAEMKQFYQEEYDKAIRRVQHIKNMLQHLGIDPVVSPPAAGKDAGYVAGGETSGGSTVKKGRKKAGRKSKWEMVIIKRLRQLDKPVTYDQLTDEIMVFSKIPAEKKTATKQAVVNVVFRLRNRDKKLETVSLGTREKYIALKGWMDGSGTLKKEYASRVDLPKPPRKKRRAGRPKKT